MASHYPGGLLAASLAQSCSSTAAHRIGGVHRGYYRRAVKDLIDYGNPFRLNAVQLDKRRLDIPTVVRAESARVSLGERISHFLPVKSFATINQHLTQVGFE